MKQYERVAHLSSEGIVLVAKVDIGSLVLDICTFCVGAPASAEVASSHNQAFQHQKLKLFPPLTCQLNNDT